VIVLVGALGLGTLAVVGFTSYESYSSVYDATYIGSAACGECHTQVYEQWRGSPHALMVRNPSPESVVGDFSGSEWVHDDTPLARTYREGDEYFMALRDPRGEYRPFRIDHVIGYQYRQVYLHEEPGGVLRRLPLQWSVERDEFFPYWNFQEKSEPSLRDLWAQMRSQNSAWNLFCARCHVTRLEILDKSPDHTTAHTQWAEDGISCEACHGPGSQHANYFAGNYVNRLAAFVNSKARGEPVAYISTATKMDRGRDMSVCARCHGPDIMMVSTDEYRRYEPGYGGDGRVNDLSAHFKEFPLQSGRTDPTVECWDDGRPRGIGMLFRSFIESKCYDAADVRCYDCHDPHANHLPASEGRLLAGELSDAYCLGCHEHLKGRIEEHTHHEPGKPGSFCFDCHMPRTIENLVGGYVRPTRTHTMSSIPNPGATVEHGASGAPNACGSCHEDQTAEWAVEWMRKWYPP
jgi:nitrate/TMAO reductase-like tetraheme cytochrome c subunit